MIGPIEGEASWEQTMPAALAFSHSGHSESPSAFVEAMAAAATPVSIVTTDGPAGCFGITVSAVTSVSADPPMVLACINRRSPAIVAIEANGVFCINMLGTDQSALANCFAGRPAEGTPFDFSCAAWRDDVSGAPVLETAVASFDCILESSQAAGTHRIVTGSVLRAQASSRQPLAYSRRAYRVLQPLWGRPDVVAGQQICGAMR